MSASNVKELCYVEELPDGTVVFTLKNIANAPSSSKQQTQEAAPEAVAHSVAEPAGSNTAAKDNGAHKGPATPEHCCEKGENTEARPEPAGDEEMGDPVVDAPCAHSLEDSTVRQLHQLCKDRGLKGYSTLNKAGLVELLSQGPIEVDAESQGGDNEVFRAEIDEIDNDGPSDLEADFDFEKADFGGLTVKQLRKACKQKGLKGYSGMRKPELISLLSRGP
jgi:hypothetical protein